MDGRDLMSTLGRQLGTCDGRLSGVWNSQLGWESWMGYFSFDETTSLRPVREHPTERLPLLLAWLGGPLESVCESLISALKTTELGL